jgi:pSer/pThr/pTyr-binding forkhead associated (FHA) protein
MKNFIKIGRDKSNDIIIKEPKVSRNHAIITILDNQSYEVKDLGSTNGTYINGQRITKQIIHPGDKLKVASGMVDWETAFQNLFSVEAESLISEEPFAKIEKILTIGSAADNNIILKNDHVSSHHARISLLKNGDYYLQDLNSRNGSYVNGTKVSAKNFTTKDVVKIAKNDLPSNWFQSFLSHHPKSASPFKTFALPTMGGLTFVETGSIIYCEGASNQTMIYLEGNKKELVSRTLRECEELLSQSNFSRIHKSYLINLSHIKKYISGKDGQLILSNGKALPVSRNYKEDFLKQFGNR